jgi:hypothetical protein
LNSPLENHEVRLRRLGGQAACGIPGSRASAAAMFSTHPTRNLEQGTQVADHDEDGPFPLTALVAAVWSFSSGEQFDDAAEFNRRVSQYHADIQGEDTWDPDEGIPLPRLRVTYFGVESPDDEEYTDFVAELASDDGLQFTAGELLRKLNNAVAPHLKGADHCYFEGLFLTEEVGDDGVPVYEMLQGS